MPVSLDQFVSLSSALTGVNATQLKPELDPIGIADQYLAKINSPASNVSPATFSALVSTFETQVGALGSPNKAAAFVLADPALGPVARSIIKMWLLGTWYDPLNVQPPQVVSSQAYKESLVWKVMQSHPMGYSMWSFGYWAAPPPAFDQFIKVNNGTSSNGSN